MSAVAATVAERPASAAEAEGEEGECTTPTAAECRIPEAASCPPAPKKPKPRRSVAQTAAAPPDREKAFFVPPNLEAIFAVRQAY